MGRTLRATQLKRLALGAVRYPRSVRQLPRLARSYGRSTLELRQPWLPFDVIDLVGQAVGPGAQIFEYGGGGSTAWFADLVGNTGTVVTVEHDREWYEMLRTVLADERNVELLSRPPTPDLAAYVGAIDAYSDGSFDVVVVDGRQRLRCFKHAVSKVRPGGLLILDDVDRDRYLPAFRYVDWPREIFHGYAPCKDDVAHTAVFRKPG